MIRLALVNSVMRDVVLAAARQSGLECRFTAYSASHLEKLKQQALLIFDSDAVEHLTPDYLQNLRRTHTTPIRHAPALVLCVKRGEIAHWRDAGCVAVMKSSNQQTITRALKEALAGADDWVTSKTYVGPSRRRRKAVLRLRARRREDAADNVAKAPPSPRDLRPQSLSVLQRRLYLGASLLTGSSLESRHAFQTLAAELHVSIVAHHRPDLARIAQSIRLEADAFVKDGQRDNRALESLVAELAAKI